MGTAGVRRQQLPQVGQAGVVPQSLCEGLGSFIPDFIAPHPEGRGKAVRGSARSPVPSAGSHAGRPQQAVSPLRPWGCGLESYSSPSASCPAFRLEGESPSASGS